ncbi:MAG: hypothetical protein GY862_06590, partial [Gammaproteobacteria bacterium]|nr:hypothetical protein [Gammaproteobacteria bacterium]
DVQAKEMVRARGYHVIPPEQGMNALTAALRHGIPLLTIGLNGGNRHIRRHTEAPPYGVNGLTALFTGKEFSPLPQTGEPMPGSQAIPDLMDKFQTPAVCDFRHLDEMPLTPAGDIDRKALTMLTGTRLTGGGKRVEPRTSTERQLADIWQSVTEVSPGIHDNFFQTGGSSLSAMQMMSRLYEVFGVEWPMHVLFKAPTIALLAERLEQDETTQIPAQPHEAENRPLPAEVEKSPISPPAARKIPRQQRRVGEKVSLSFAQERLWFMNQLEPDSPFYNIAAAFRISGYLHVAALQHTLNAIVRRHESLRTTFGLEDGKPVQNIAFNLNLDLKIMDLQAVDIKLLAARVSREIVE